MARNTPKPTPAQKEIRCAVYTRKSTEEGLEQEFNTLDAQRESGEAYIAAQKHEGWTCLPDRYDDGGFTGGNMERPALRRLLADIETGRVNCVVVYKVDRLSRSLLDFARIMQVFDARGVSFVSVTQRFDTSNSMGRLMLNVLLSFAQFEREIISERTRDKIAAARRKGKFSGGKPLLGYDIVSSPAGARLVVNEVEAAQIRAIFELYIEHQALIAVVKELASRGWTNKKWTTRKGDVRGGRPFDKSTLYKLLTNPTYIGLVTYKDETHPGEHPGIVSKEIWEKVRAILSRNGATGGATVRNRYGALLKGVLYCSNCHCAMFHTYTIKSGGVKRYRYYVCLQAQKRGWHTCPTKSVPAVEIENFVVEQIKSIGQDPAVIEGTLRQMRQQRDKELADVQTQNKVLERERRRLEAGLAKAGNGDNRSAHARLQEELGAVEQKLSVLSGQIQELEREAISAADVSSALTAFTPMWEQLTPKEQAKAIALLIQRIDYDGKAGTVSITFHNTGIQALTREQEMAA